MNTFREPPKTVRVCDLNRGDVFSYGNIDYIVIQKTDTQIFYRSLKSNWANEFGAKNQMKVELVNPHKEPVTINEYRKSITRYNNIKSIYHRK